MKTPIWEVSAGALEALLESNQFVYCDLYTYTAADGTVLARIATADVDVAIPGLSATWPAKYPLHSGVGGSRPLAHWKIGLDIDTWQVRVSPRKTNPFTSAAFPDKLAGVPWLQSVRIGNLDGSTLRVDRAYFADWSVSAAAWGAPGLVPVGVLTVFVGPIVAVDFDQGGIIVTANDYRVLLSSAMPRELFTLGCRHMLYGPGCTLLLASFTVSGSVSAGSTRGSIVSVIAAPPGSGTYALGQIAVTSGPNTGFSRFVRAWAGGVFTTIAPFPYDFGIGDTFDASAGCDKTKPTCVLFANVDNYGGEDFTPAPETAI